MNPISARKIKSMTVSTTVQTRVSSSKNAVLRGVVKEETTMKLVLRLGLQNENDVPYLFKSIVRQNEVLFVVLIKVSEPIHVLPHVIGSLS